MSLNTIHLPRVLATSGAIGLVLASAGFGALYAYKVGIQHSIVLAGLSVLMVLALEAVKPLAISAGIDLWKRCTGPAALLLTLGGISCAYSLTAELSLISMSKGDIVAERQAQATTARNAERDRNRIEAELAAIGITQPSASLSAELSSLLSDSRLKGCTSPLSNWRLQAICTEKVTPLRSELATAERREKLEASLAQLPSVAAKVADPGSVALATYLAALGVNLSAEAIAQWLILIPVLALEIGSAMAGVLVQAVSQSPAKGVSEPPKKPANRREPPKPEPAAGKDNVAKAIVQELQAAGGSLSRSERGLARLIGTSKPTARRAIHGLAAAGIIALEATKAGTMLRLVA